jgi:hypothetical protein
MATLQMAFVQCTSFPLSDQPISLLLFPLLIGSFSFFNGGQHDRSQIGCRAFDLYRCMTATMTAFITALPLTSCAYLPIIICNGS